MAWTPKGKTRAPGSGSQMVTGGIAGNVTLPSITEVDGSSARPSILASGGSGTGKTWGIEQMLRGGKNILIGAVESKIQALMAHNPKVIFFGAPIEDRATGAKRSPTASEVYQRLQMFKDRLGEGEFREHNGKPFDLIAIDGLMEVGAVIHRHFRENTPISKSTGERNTYAMADEIGVQTVDFVKGIRDAASAASELYGIPPVGVYATCGEFAIEPKLGGDVQYKPALYGNVGPRNIPFAFEAVLHLEVDRDDEGRPRYLAHTAPNQPVFFAKAPAALDPILVNWNMNDVYDQIVTSYRGEA